MRRYAALSLAGLSLLLTCPRSGFAEGLKADGRAGTVTAAQGVALVRPVGRERWTPLDPRALLFPGDVLRTEARGANALEIRLAGGARLVVGPGSMLELPDDGGVRILRGELEVKPVEKAPMRLAGPGGYAKELAATTWLRATDRDVKELAAEPKWLTGYRASTSEEWMGALLATVDGKNVPLTVGYHKVVVEIRDQIARTTVEESFVNSTDATLEGVFSFPLPADASISGFGMWIGDELVEADLVEKQRAREIYEDILRRKKDPGLLEWEGGNLFKARVFPIFPHGEKRIRLRYTQVLPLEGDTYRYRYALRSELLRQHPLRELSMAVNVISAAAIKDVSSPTHPVTLRKTDHEAVAEFGAQEYAPDRDFELAVTLARGDGLSAIAHRRGDDGFFMVLLSPPDPAAAGWQRDLLPEGDPLDLVLVADTSGSMEPRARESQSTFLAALLGQLSPKDRFRLLAVDVEPVWLAEEPLSATEENAARVLAALDARLSLGWTDIDRAFDAVLAKAKAGTQVIYVGDGIPTAGDADPVATVDRLRTKAKGTAATFHAISTSAAYERGVLEGIASIGGGSARRADDAPAATAKALLTEVARPGLRDLRIEIKGPATARIYPLVLPNVPLGQQQVVLGRFLPGPEVKTGEIVATGTLAGKPVRYTSSFAVPAAEEGNSFLPRLWARRHLDVLLAQGKDARTQEEIVSFSREYQIMTPYTSFLVLENDEDRAKYGVERTVKMRDAERFFADARDKAALEIARQQMQTAHRWRLDLRRRMRQEIESLGRDLDVPVALGWMETGENRGILSGQGDVGDGDGRGRISGITSWESGIDYEGPRGLGGELRYFDIKDVGMEAGLKYEGIITTDGVAVPMAAPCCAPAPAPGAVAPAGGEAAEDEEGSDAPGLREPSDPTPPPFDRSEESVAGRQFDDAMDASKSKDNRARAGGAGGYFRGPMSAPPFRGSARDLSASIFPSLPRPGPMTARDLGFPDLEPGTAVKAPPSLPDPAWDPAAIEALRALDRRPGLASIPGALRVTSEARRLHPLTGREEPSDRTRVLWSPRRWHATAEGIAATPTQRYVSETERGVIDDTTRLGRKRPATDADRAAEVLPLVDASLRDLLRACALAYRRAPKVSHEGDAVTIVFSADADPGLEQTWVIDRVRKILLAERESLDGKTTVEVRFADFVQVAGQWWATKIETLDGDGKVVARRTTKVEGIDAAEFAKDFDAATSAYGDVIFLGENEPALTAARQRVRDGQAAFADPLVVALWYAARQRWDDAWKAYEAAEALVAGKPGAAWMRLALLGRSRRGEVYKAHAFRMAASTAADATALAPSRARTLDALSHGLGARERLDLFDAVRAAYTRPGPDADAWALHARWRQAQAYDEVGLPYPARATRTALAKDRPWDLRAVLSHARDLHDGEDQAAALAYLEERCLKGGPWTQGELNALFAIWTAWLYERRDLATLETAAREWVTRSPRAAEAHRVETSVAYLRGRAEVADRAVLAALEADIADLANPGPYAARGAAIQIALGDGWGFQTRTIPQPFRKALADLALRLVRSDGRFAGLTAPIVPNWRFQQSEEARVLRATLLADVTAEGAVAGMPLPRLARYVDSVALNGPDVTEAQWRGVVDALLLRWRSTAEAADAEILANLVRRVIDGRGALAERLAFLRERLGKATDRDARRIAQDLFDSILGAPHAAALEDEAFALLPRLLDARDGDLTSRARAASASRRLAAWVHTARLAAASGTPEERAKWTRAEATQHATDARKTARTETSARLATAVAAAGIAFRPWLEVERLGYAVESLADLAKAEGDARELLDGVPTSSEEEIDGLLAERAALVLEYAATRRAAPAGLADRVLALLRARLEAKDKALDGRYEIFRLLVALDRVEELEKTLTDWIRPDDVDVTWRVALAYVQAETNRLREAATTLEAAATLSELGGEEWSRLATWYLVLKEDARREQALDRRDEALPEDALARRVWMEVQRVQRRGDGVPLELDPDVLRTARILLARAERPDNQLQAILGLYLATKDVRVLESLADAMTGHSPESQYAVLQHVTAAIGEVFEEATCDALTARAAAALTRATTDVDRRALRLLVAAVETRAALVPNPDPRHGPKAIDAMRQAYEGTFVPGERTLLAAHLAALGAPPNAAIAAEQLRQLEALLAGATEGAWESFSIGQHLVGVLWGRGRRQDAADRLASSLDAVRSDSGGTLPQGAQLAYEQLMGWWTEMGRFRQAEDRLRADLASEPRSGRKEQLQMRVFALYVAAVERRGSLSPGSGADLFRAAAAEMERALAEIPAYLLALTVGRHGELHVAASKSGAVRNTGALYERFVVDRLPRLYERMPLDRLELLSSALGPLEQLAGPRSALRAAIVAIETEPSWYERIAEDVWSRHSNSMADWRSKAEPLGDLEPRLLPIVLRHLDDALSEGDNVWSNFWWRNSAVFWKEHRSDFAGVSARVAEVHASEAALVLRVAQYQRNGLDLHPESVATLQMALAHTKDLEILRAPLAGWLHEDGRDAEAWSVAQSLIADRPDNLGYRLLGAATLHALGRDPEAGTLLEEAAARWKDKKAWNSGLAVSLARAALEARQAPKAAEWIENALQLRREAGGGAGPDGALSAWYQILARARSLLGETDAAVKAAAAAVVAGSRDDAQRVMAFATLDEVLVQAKDLDAWAGRYDAEVAASGLDAPVMRKALGRLYAVRGRNDLAAVQFRAARDLDPLDAETHGLFVRALDAVGDAPGGLAALLASVRLAPKNLDAYHDLAGRFFRAGDPAQAERAKTNLVEAMPSEPDGYRSLAKIREANRRWALAAHLWGRVTEVRPKEPEGWLELGRTQALAGDKAAARAALEHVIRTTWDERFGDVQGEARRRLDQVR